MTLIENLTFSDLIVRPYPTNGLDEMFLGTNSVQQVTLPPGVWELTRGGFVSVVDCTASGMDHRVTVMPFSEYVVPSMTAGKAFLQASLWILPVLVLAFAWRWIKGTLVGAAGD